MAVSSYNRTEEAQFSTSSLSFHLKMPYNGTMLLLKYIAALLLPVHRTPEDMMKVRNLGRKSLEEVLAKLKELGLQLNQGDEV